MTVSQYMPEAAPPQPYQPQASAFKSWGSALPYGLLRQTRPADPPCDRGYDAKTWAELSDLHKGGYTIQEHAGKYIKPSVNELPERYQERLRLAAYINYLGGLVNGYTAAIHQRPISVTAAADADDKGTPGELPDPETFEDFASNADLRGGTFQSVLRGATETALVKGKALIAVDFPVAESQPQTLRDSKSMGIARPYCYEVEPEQLIDWEYSSQVQRTASIGKDANGEERRIDFTIGKFSWAILRTVIHRREAPTVSRTAPVEEFRMWERLPSGVISWKLYRTPPMPKNGTIQDDVLIPLVAEGETKFTEIPIVELRLPDTLWLGNMIGLMCKEHWQRRSALLAGQQRALLPMAIIYLGSEIGGFQQPQPSESQQDPGRGETLFAYYTRLGFGVLGKDDKLAFEAPPTAAFEIVDKELDALVNEIYRVAGKMAAGISSTAKALARSGASKKADQEDFLTCVAAIAVIVSDAARRVYQVISEALGEDVNWTVHGLDGYEDTEDRATLIEELLQIPALAIPSATFLAAIRIRGAKRLLPGSSPAEQKQIEDEIIAGTTAEETLPSPKVSLDTITDDVVEPEVEPPTVRPGEKPASKKPAKGAR